MLKENGPYIDVRNIYIYIIINYQVLLAFIEDEVGGADLEKEEEPSEGVRSQVAIACLQKVPL